MTADIVGSDGRKYDERAKADPLSIYVVVNGSLGMSDGKIAAQVYQLAVRMAQLPEMPNYRQWMDEGTRTVTRVAQTAYLWERVLAELDGVAFRDEGMTEVAKGSVTVFATWPTRRSEAPKLLTHKRIPLL